MSSRSSKEYQRGKRILDYGSTYIKYVPIAIALIMDIYCLILEAGFRFDFMDTIFATSIYGALVLISASYAYGFCTLHRSFIVYDSIMSICLDYQTKQGYGFGQHLPVLHWLMFAIGFILFVWLAFRRFNLCENSQQYQPLHSASRKQ